MMFEDFSGAEMAVDQRRDSFTDARIARSNRSLLPNRRLFDIL
jgi:hypothetical protein